MGMTVGGSVGVGSRVEAECCGALETRVTRVQQDPVHPVQTIVQTGVQLRRGTDRTHLEKPTAAAETFGVLARLVHSEGDAVDEYHQHRHPLEPRVDDDVVKESTRW